MGALNLASWGLLVGVTGQLFFFNTLFPHVPKWIVIGVVYIPFLIIYTISFCKGMPCGPRQFRKLLLFAMGYYVFITILAEVLNIFFHPAPKDHFSIVQTHRAFIFARVPMYLAMLTFIVFIRACKTLRSIEAKSET